MKSILIIMFFSIFVSAVKAQKDTIKWQTVSVNQKFPEGPAWSEADNSLYVSNCYGNWITRIKDDKADTLLIADSVNYIKTNGMIVSGDAIYACDYGLGAILKITGGKSEILIPGFNGKPFNRPNDITFDNNGNLYFSDPKSYGKNKPDGRIFFYNIADGKLILAADSLTFPNGLGISPIDGRLYLSESARSRILSFKRNENGVLTDKKVFIELPGGDPDGMNFDTKGNMYVAHFGGGALFVISHERKIINRIKTPGKKPSNVEFGGKNLNILYLTEDETNSVYKTELNERGFKIH